MTELSYNRNITIGIIIVLVGLAGAFYYSYSSFRRININQAERTAEDYLESLGDPNLAIAEIMEFEYNYYVVYYEKSTGIGAFEMLIDKRSGRIFPEYGPNMMWNIKYGHGGMMGGPGGMIVGFNQPLDETIDEEEALVIAKAFLDEVYPGQRADDPHPFYGYYTIHTIMDGEISGMLSVNAFDGAVWYHSWHGSYVRSIEEH